MNKIEIKKFRKWMLENYGIQDASNYEGTQTEEIAIRYADSKVKKLNKPVVKRRNAGIDEDLEYELKRCLTWMERIEPIWAREFKAWLPNYLEALRLQDYIKARVLRPYG